MKVSLVIPCYNEEHRLPIAEFERARVDAHDLELVFVDDGSQDGTRSLLERFTSAHSPTTRLVAYDANAGKAEAVRRGVEDALLRRPDADAIGYWDADLATPLSELPFFIDRLERSPEVDVVIGSRVKLMGRQIERQVWRHLVGRVFATAASTSLRLPVYDTQCGAKLFRVTPLMRRVFSTPFESRWIFDVELLARYAAFAPEGTAYLTRALYEVPLRKWVDVRGSKLRPGDFMRAAFDLAAIHRMYRPAR